jgi:sterol desaturase/sphingolipid hydroxylase (fatty acid hydroxylase superfamily)
MSSSETTYQIARSASAALALLLALTLERFRRHERMRPAWGTNLGLFAVDGVVTGIACGACGWTLAAWAATHDVGLLAWAGTPRWLAACAGVVALDAVSWLWHAANHRVRLLWRFHQVHHADTSFHATTSLRFHPGELLLALPVRLAAIVVLGVPAVGVLAFEVAFGIANVLEHGNFDWPRPLDRRLQRVLVTPSVHRAHHVSDWRELDSNFGTIFSLWDRMARTFRTGDPERRVTTGLPDWPRPHAPSLSQSLWLPFAARRGRPR